MAHPHRLQDYLLEQDIPFDLLTHQPSESSLGTAMAARIPMIQLAKAVMLEDHESKRLMAILPASYKISIHRLNNEFHRKFHLIKESALGGMFEDCEPGAVPPGAQAYHLDMIFDDVLSKQPDIYLEAGDHQTLIHLNHDAFIRFVTHAKHGRFSRQIYH